MTTPIGTSGFFQQRALFDVQFDERVIVAALAIALRPDVPCPAARL